MQIKFEVKTPNGDAFIIVTKNEEGKFTARTKGISPYGEPTDARVSFWNGVIVSLETMLMEMVHKDLISIDNDNKSIGEKIATNIIIAAMFGQPK